MPIMVIHLLEGRSQEQKDRLIEKLTDAAVDALDAPRSSVRIMIQEMPKGHFGIGGETAEKLGR